MANPRLLVAPLTAFLIGLCAVWVIRRIALVLGFVDNPDRRRKLHEAPIALGGGIAVWLATWCGWDIGQPLGGSRTSMLGGTGWFYAGLASASLVILVVGVLDDRYGLRARHKLLGQLVAATVLVVSGLRIDAWTSFGVEVTLGILAYPVTVFWILLVVNAFNLIDGMDGFCGSLGFVAALAIAVLASWTGRLQDAALALALAGALAAFLKDNLPPAKVYLGDAGSLMTGLMIAALALRACSNGPDASVSLLPLIALMIVPLLDVVTALGRRSLTGRSIFTPDRGHLHHCLRNRLGSTGVALGVAVGLATLAAGGAVLAKAQALGDLVPCLAIVIPVGLLLITNTFGGSEVRLLFYRIQTALAWLLTGGAVRQREIRQECHLHGNRDWAGVWDALIRAVEAEGVRRVELAIDIAAAGEVYHGLWSSPTGSEEGSTWSVVHTLYSQGVPAGILRVSGSVNPRQTRYLQRVEELVRLLEGQLDAGIPSPAPPTVPAPPFVNIPVTAPQS